MASIYKVEDSLANTGGKLNEVTPYIYNVSHSVGWCGMNERNDVLLIQNLLNIFAPKMNIQRLKTDGICGHKTVMFLIAFQEFLHEVNPAISDDQRIDPIRNHQYLTPNQLYGYTIFFLNTSARLTGYESYLNIGRSVPLRNRHLFAEMKSYYDKTRWVTTPLTARIK